METRPHGARVRAAQAIGAAAAAAAVGLAVPAAAAPPPSPLAAQSALVRQDFSNCGNSDVSAGDPGRVGGSIALRQQPGGATTADVTVVHGTPNTSYTLYLKCVRALGVIHTNDAGAGAGSFSFQAQPGGVVTFDMYPAGAPRGNKFQSTRYVWNAPVLPNLQRQIAQTYAPLIWLNPGESWMPSSIDYYALSMNAVCDGKQAAGDIRSLTLAMLPPGRGAPSPGSDATHCFFVTKQALSGPYDRPSFLHGQDPSKTPVPIYVFIYQDAGQHSPGDFDVQYMTFYPYNLGKNICTGLAPKDNCIGSRIEMGDHVADWELMTIRFANNQPVAVHVGSHGNDIPDTAWTFFAPGWTNTGNAANGSVLAWEGAHPVVYSADGSHGVYGWGGKHNYKTTPVGDQWNDYTGQGTRWQTWQNIVWSDDPRYALLLNQYEGRWGNPHMGKSGCEVSQVPNWSCSALGIPTDEYQLNDGPSLPDRQRDKSYMYQTQ
jgi:hypothetical protein